MSINVDDPTLLNALGRLSLLKIGFDQVRLNRPPFVIEIGPTGKRMANTVDEFVVETSKVLDSVEQTLQGSANSLPK